MPTSKHDLETFLGFGFYQIFHYLVFNWSVLSGVSNMSFMVFGGAFPKLFCQPTEDFGISKETIAEMDHKTICKMWKNGSCANFTVQIDFTSVASEWGLICDKAGLVYLASSVQMAGVLVGTPTFGQLSDLFGRKKMSICCIFGALSVGAASSLSPNIQIFTAFRFLIGFFTGGSIASQYVFFIEFMRKKHRLVIMALSGWPLSYMIFSLLAYLAADWRKLSLYGNVAGLPVLILIFFTKESPRWLIQRGRLEEAQKIFLELAKWNRHTINLTELKETIDMEREKLLEQGHLKKPTFFHLFYTWKFVRRTVALSFAWFSIGCVSYGLLFNIEKLSGNRYLNMLYYGFLRLTVGWGSAAAEVFLKRCGRKVFHLLSGGFMTVSCAVVFVLTVTGAHESQREAIRVLCLSAKCVTTMLWMVVYLLSVEAYPTPIRSLANGFCSISARLGAILAPQLLFLGHAWEPGPFLFFMIMMALDVIVFQLVLPETKGKPLPDHMPDKSERIFASMRQKKDKTSADEACEMSIPLKNL